MWVSLQSLILNPVHKRRFEKCVKLGVSRIWTRFGQVFVADSHLRNLQIFSLNDASPPSQDAAIESLNLQSEIIHISFPVWCLDSFWIVTGDGLLQHFVKGNISSNEDLGATWRWKSTFHLLMEEEEDHQVTEVLVHDTHRSIYIVSRCKPKDTCNIWKISALVTGPQDVTLGLPKKILEECPLFSLVGSSTSLYGWATKSPCPPNVFFSWSSTGQLTVKNTSRQQWACTSIRFRHACWEAVALWAQNPSKTINRMLTIDQHLVVIDEEFQVSVLRESDGKTVRSFCALDSRELSSKDINVAVFHEHLLVLQGSSLKMYPSFTEDKKPIEISVPIPSRGWKIYVSEDPARTVYVYEDNTALVMWDGKFLDRGMLDVLDGWVSMYEDGAEKFTVEWFRGLGHERLKPPLRVDPAVAVGLARKRHDTMEARGNPCDSSEEMRRLLRDVLSERSGIFLRKQVVDVCERYASLIDAVENMGVDP